MTALVTQEHRTRASTGRKEPDFERLTFPVSVKSLTARVNIEGERKAVTIKQKAVMRDDTQAVLGIVTPSYQLVPHQDIFHPLHDAVLEMNVPIKRVMTHVGPCGGYAKVDWDLDVEEPIGDPSVGDIVGLRLTARNSLNQASRLTVELGALRLICTNGLVAPGRQFRFAVPHVKSLSVPKALEHFNTVIEKAPKMLGTWANWAAIGVDTEGLSNFLGGTESRKQVLGTKARKEIVDYFEKKDQTVWEAYNAITWFATHQIKCRKEDQLVVRSDAVQMIANQFGEEFGRN